MIEERTNKEFKNVDDKSFEMFLFYVEKSINFLVLTSFIEADIRQIAKPERLEPEKTILDYGNIYGILNHAAEKDNVVSTLQQTTNKTVSFIISFLKIFVVCSKNCLNR